MYRVIPPKRPPLLACIRARTTHTASRLPRADARAISCTAWRRCMQSCSCTRPPIGVALAPSRARSFLRLQERAYTQQAYGYPDSSSQAVDSDLFEEEDWQYDQTSMRHDPEQGTYDVQSPQAILYAALESGDFDKATTLMINMQELRTEIEPSGGFAHIALYYAKRGDFEQSMQWIRLVPPRATCDDGSQEDQLPAIERSLGAFIKQLRDDSQHELSWKLLLYLARLGYLETQRHIRGEVINSLGWLMQDAYRQEEIMPNGQSVGDWSVSFFEKLFDMALRSTNGVQVEKASATLSSDLQDDATPAQDGRSVPENIRRNFFLFYNICIRALCRDHRFETALQFTLLDFEHGSRPRMSKTFQVAPFTLHTFLHHVTKQSLSRPDDEGLKGILKTIAANVRNARQKRPHVERLVKLSSVVDIYSTSEVYEQIRNERSHIEKTIRRAFDEKRPGQGISVLCNAIENNRFLPSDSILTLVSSAPPQEGIRLVEESLNKANGTRVTNAILPIVEQQEKESHAQALRSYFERFSDRHLFSLANAAIQHDRGLIEAIGLSDPVTSMSTHLNVNRSASVTALRSLILLLRDDAKHLDRLYDLWLRSVASFSKHSATDDRLSCSSALSTSRPEMPDNLQPSLLAPQARHFMLFARYLPRAFTKVSRRAARRLAPDLGAPASTFEQSARVEAGRRAIQIANDMSWFGYSIDAGGLTLLLDALIRNIDLYDGLHAAYPSLHFLQDDQDDWSEWQRVEAILAYFDLGGRDASSESLGLDRQAEAERKLEPSPLTYTYIIRALLSVPRARGGPLLSGAEVVKQWFEADEHAQEQLKLHPERYSKHVQLALTYLDNIQSQISEREARQTEDQEEGDEGRGGGESELTSESLPTISEFAQRQDGRVTSG